MPTHRTRGSHASHREDPTPPVELVDLARSRAEIVALLSSAYDVVNPLCVKAAVIRKELEAIKNIRITLADFERKSQDADKANKWCEDIKKRWEKAKSDLENFKKANSGESKGTRQAEKRQRAFDALSKKVRAYDEQYREASNGVHETIPAREQSWKELICALENARVLTDEDFGTQGIRGYLSTDWVQQYWNFREFCSHIQTVAPGRHAKKAGERVEDAYKILRKWKDEYDVAYIRGLKHKLDGYDGWNAELTGETNDIPKDVVDGVKEAIRAAKSDAEEIIRDANATENREAFGKKLNGSMENMKKLHDAAVKK